MQASDVETGQEVFTLKKKIFSLRTAWTIQRGGSTLATIQKNFFSMHETICVYPGENTSAEPIFTVKADLFRSRNRTFYAGSSDHEVASSHEQVCNMMGI